MIPSQHSTANLVHFGWPRTLRTWRLYSDKSLEPETENYLSELFSLWADFKILGIADNFEIKFTELDL